MNDNLMFEYLLSMGTMRPEQEELLRKQKMVDALREQAGDAPEAQMVSGHYVAPSITQYAAQLMKGYGAGKGQKEVYSGLGDMNARQQKLLEDLRKRWMEKQGLGYSGGVDQSNPFTYGLGG